MLGTVAVMGLADDPEEISYFLLVSATLISSARNTLPFIKIPAVEKGTISEVPAHSVVPFKALVVIAGT